MSALSILCGTGVALSMFLAFTGPQPQFHRLHWKFPSGPWPVETIVGLFFIHRQTQWIASVAWAKHE